MVITVKLIKSRICLLWNIPKSQPNTNPNDTALKEPIELAIEIPFKEISIIK